MKGVGNQHEILVRTTYVKQLHRHNIRIYQYLLLKIAKNNDRVFDCQFQFLKLSLQYGLFTHWSPFKPKNGSLFGNKHNEIYHLKQPFCQNNTVWLVLSFNLLKNRNKFILFTEMKIINKMILSGVCFVPL